MPQAHIYRDVDVPDNFPDWDRDAQINYLSNAMSRKQIANFVREIHGLESRDKPLFRKDELAEIATERVNGNA